MYQGDGRNFDRFLARVVFNDLLRLLRCRNESFLEDVRTAISVRAQDIIITLCCFVECT